MKPGDRIKVGNQEHVAVKDTSSSDGYHICSVRNECGAIGTALCKGNPVHFIVTDQIPIEPILDMLSEKNAELKGKVFYYTEREVAQIVFDLYTKMLLRTPNSDRLNVSQWWDDIKKK